MPEAPRRFKDYLLVDMPGVQTVSDGFLAKVDDIASDLGVNPNFLMAVMSFETGGTYSPSVKNKAGSGAVGLIQFMSATATGLGTTTQNLAAMTAEVQLDYVARHFKRFKGKLQTIEDTYMAVLYPAAVGKGAAHVLFKKGTTAYKQNSGLDIDGDGVITVGDASDKVRKLLGGAPGGTGEVLKRRARGPEVERLQHELFDLGYLRLAQIQTGPGIFGGQTEAALKAFQHDNYIEASGANDPDTQAAFRQLNTGVRLGASGGVVRGLQDRLVALGYMTAAEALAGPGNFGEITEAALIMFQRQAGVQPNGALTDETYRALATAAPIARAGPAATDSKAVETVLPASGLGYTTYAREPGGADQYGRASTVRALQALGEAWAARHPERPFAIGDMSRRGGGPFPPHKSHHDGRDADLRPLTNNGIDEPTNVGASNYSYELTRELVLLIGEKFAGHTIFFNDPRLIKEKLTKHIAGHDNHLHVRFPDSAA